MKKILLLIVILMMILVAERPVRVDDPDFCYDGWVLVDQELIFAGGGCTIYRNTYHCYSTQTERVEEVVHCN
jgi:hypothetical protein